MEAIKESLWKCRNCGVYYRDETKANNCCSDYKEPEKVCQDCGTTIDHKSYFTVCESCREKRRFKKCTKMTQEEYSQKFPENYIVHNDNYYPNIEDMMESLSFNWESEDDVPKYVYGTKMIYATVDIDNAIERALEDAYEDAEFPNTDELYDFVSQWNDKNKLTMFEETNTVIMIPEELRQEYIELIEKQRKGNENG